jgi:hypothetical protein
LLREINPFMKVTALDYAPESKEELKTILEDATVVIDAIDYLGFDYKVRFAQAARHAGLYNFTAPISGLGTALFIFAPDGMTLEMVYDAPQDTSLWSSHRLPADRLLGPSRFGNLVTDMNEGRRDYLSNCGGIATLNGGFVATEIALYITGLRPANELVVAPHALYIDLLKRVFEVYDLMENQSL